MRAGCLKSAIRKWITPNQRSAFERNVPRLLIAATVALMAAPLSATLAADDIQQIKLGPHTFYMPKAWMHRGLVSASASSGAEIAMRQPGSIEAVRLLFQPQSDWRLSIGELPRFIIIGYVPRTDPPPLSTEIKQWLDIAAARRADSDGFVRVATGFIEPGKPPEWERFLYKGYQNKLAEPLIIKSSNDRLVLSVVDISVQQDMGIQYRFDNKTFPENTWWELYQRVLKFLDYLQTPR